MRQKGDIDDRGRVSKAEARLNEALLRATERLETATAKPPAQEEVKEQTRKKAKRRENKPSRHVLPQDLPDAKRRDVDEQAYKDAVEQAVKSQQP